MARLRESAHTVEGQYGTITFPSGQTRSYSYDDQGRLTQLANVHPTAGTLASFAYGYDIDPQTQQPTLLGQRTSLAMTIPSQGLSNATSSYRYDTDYQLTQATYPAPAPYNSEVHAWTYDGIGNRLTNTVDGTPQAYTYLKNGANPLNGQRLSSDSVNAYTYDANGNTVTRNGSGGSFTFGWNTDDRMTSISGSATASYVYDYQGRRTKKALGGAVTSYLYDGLNLVRDIGASSTTEYLFGPGIDEPLATVPDGNVSYFSVDGLGSVALLNDAGGTVQNSYLYDAWGVVRSQTGTVANDFGYTSREFGEAGLWFYRTRYDQPGIGRFISRDPFRPHGPGESYAYADRRPTTLVDGLGLFSYSASCSGAPWGKGLMNDVKDMCTRTSPGTGCYRALQNISAAMGGNADDLPRCYKKGCDGQQPIGCDPCYYDCGGSYPTPGQPTIILGKGGASSCPKANGFGYGETVFHEMLHVCGFSSEPHNQGWQASWFRYAEKACYGWRSPLAPPVGPPL